MNSSNIAFSMEHQICIKVFLWSLNKAPDLSLYWYLSFIRALPADYVRMDQDILSPLAGKKELYTYETLDFWEQIKTPGWKTILPFFFPAPDD